MFCKHDWKVLDSKILPSAAEVAKLSGAQISFRYASNFQQKYYYAYSCSKCGKLHNGTVVSSASDFHS